MKASRVLEGHISLSSKDVLNKGEATGPPPFPQSRNYTQASYQIGNKCQKNAISNQKLIDKLPTAIEENNWIETKITRKGYSFLCPFSLARSRRWLRRIISDSNHCIMKIEKLRLFFFIKKKKATNTNTKKIPILLLNRVNFRIKKDCGPFLHIIRIFAKGEPW